MDRKIVRTTRVAAQLQDDSEAGLRCQMRALGSELAVTESFFARLMNLSSEEYRAWATGNHTLSYDNRLTLAALARMHSHIQALFAFDLQKVRQLYELPVAAGGSPEAPPWKGGSLRKYLEDGGKGAITNATEWFDQLRFSNRY
jgi:hypothetical protein